jgi:hypothetical protein
MNKGLDEAILSEIARQSQVSFAVVQGHYHTLLSDLRSRARIHDFIPLLAMKLVRQQFRPIAGVASQAMPTERQRIKRLARELDFTQINFGH